MYRNHRLPVVATVTGLVFLIFSVATYAGEPVDGVPATVHHESVVSITQLANASRADAEYQIMRGEMALAEGDQAQAAEAYGKALDFSTQPDLARRTLQMAIAANDVELAFKAAQAWSKSSQDDVAAQRTALRLAFLRQDQDAVTHYADRVLEVADSPRTGYDILFQVLGDKPDQADQALATMQELAEKHPDEAAAQYGLARLALGYDRLDVADKASRKAVAMAPDWAQTGLLRADVDVRRGHFDAARKQITELKGSKQQRSQYHLAFAQTLMRAKQKKMAAKEFRHAVSLDPENDDARFALGVIALSRNKPDKAEVQFEKLAEQKAHANSANFYLGVIAEHREKPEKAEQFYQEVKGGRHFFAAQLGIVRLTYKAGHVKKAREQLQALSDKYPDHRAHLLAVEGSLLLEAGQPRQALAVYDQALEKAGENRDGLLYARALVYSKLDRIDEAKADLKTILAAHPDDADALNALGYMLTNHGTDYARAEKYIRKAHALEPDSPAILDSLGWVEYKAGRTETAYQYLKEAYKAQPDPEIAAHLGEVLWHQGNHEAAHDIWNKALKNHPDNQILVETVKRLTS